MKGRILIFFVIVSSLFGYLEWGNNEKSFLFQIEAEIFTKFFDDPLSVIHPFVLIPFFGQILLTVTLFQKYPNKILLYSGIGGIGILMLLVCLVACLNLNLKMIASTIPFFIFTFFAVRQSVQKRTETTA